MIQSITNSGEQSYLKICFTCVVNDKSVLNYSNPMIFLNECPVHHLHRALTFCIVLSLTNEISADRFTSCSYSVSFSLFLCIGVSTNVTKSTQ